MNSLNLKNLHDLFVYSTEHFGANKAFYTLSGEGYTYREFKEKTEHVANLVHYCGLNQGDKIAILSPSLANWPVAFFSITAFDKVAVPLLTDFSTDEISNILEHSESKALFISKKLLHKISDNVMENLSTVIIIETFEILKGEIIERKDPLPVTEGSGLATIIYTSGTTGSSKGVMLSHKNWCANLVAAEYLRPGYEWDIWLSFLPLSHSYECSLGLILPMVSGSSVYYLEKPPTATVLMSALKQVRPTTILSVPLIMEKLYRNAVLPKFQKNRWIKALYQTTFGRKLFHYIAGRKIKKQFGGRLRFFGIGGAKLDGEVERFLLEAKFPYGIGYGLTETSPLLAGANPQMVKWQSTGPAVHGVELRIDNPNPLTGEGEIVAKGNNIMMGYYKNPEATAAAFTSDGWFKTKDLGFIDKDQCVYIRGRLGNMIVGSSGENIYPEEIESVINNHEIVEESIVIQRDGKLVALIHLNADKLKAFIEEKQDKVYETAQQVVDKLVTELQNFVNSKVSKFSRINTIELSSGQFEKTPTLKIKRYLYK
jgi:long-chain acyl-CoA synthetase